MNWSQFKISTKKEDVNIQIRVIVNDGIVLTNRNRSFLNRLKSAIMVFKDPNFCAIGFLLDTQKNEMLEKAKKLEEEKIDLIYEYKRKYGVDPEEEIEKELNNDIKNYEDKDIVESWGD